MGASRIHRRPRFQGATGPAGINLSPANPVDVVATSSSWLPAACRGDAGAVGRCVLPIIESIRASSISQGGLPMHSTAAGYAPLAVAGGTQQRCEICSVGRAERRCARFAQRRSSPQGSSPRRPVEVSSGLLRLSRLHAPAVTDDAARARRPSGHTAAPPPRRRSEPPRAPWHLRCPAALGGERSFSVMQRGDRAGPKSSRSI